MQVCLLGVISAKRNNISVFLKANKPKFYLDSLDILTTFAMFIVLVVVSRSPVFTQFFLRKLISCYFRLYFQKRLIEFSSKSFKIRTTNEAVEIERISAQITINVLNCLPVYVQNCASLTTTGMIKRLAWRPFSKN